MTNETFSQALQRIRRERGVSYRELSSACHVDSGHLCKIEKGQRPCTMKVAEAIDRALDADGALVAIAREERRQRVRAAVTSDSMKRRTLVRWGVTASALASIGGVSDLAEPVGRVGVADAERLLRAATRLRQLGHLHGGESLWQAAAALVGDSYRLLEHGSYTVSVEQRLLRAAGRAHMAAGWLAFDAGRHDVARSCYNEALNLARQAADAGTEAHALANLAFQSNIIGRPREAMRLAEAASRAAARPHGVARLSAMPHLRRAVAFATSADPRGAAAAMTEARRVLDRDGDKPTPEWCAFLTQVELDGLEGTCALELGQPERAEALLVRAIAGHADQFARNRALYRVRLARARLDRRVIEGAAEAANAALDDLSGELGSWVVSNELAAIAGRFEPYDEVPQVERFLARYTRSTR
ncbi:helix-turn-helix domain-containing protein [Dactylosporangium sp. CA-139066]|uniref:helix-turn-helix domain-containing protein n=1 Tax=Dactylosporangium sp. CA-139066 TaxID=3239930 RepID=UPI003D8E3C52